MAESTDMPEGYPFMRIQVVVKDIVSNDYVRRNMTVDYTQVQFMYWYSRVLNGEKCTMAYLDNGDKFILAIGYKAACNMIEPFNNYRFKTTLGEK